MENPLQTPFGETPHSASGEPPVSADPLEMRLARACLNIAACRDLEALPRVVFQETVGVVPFDAVRLTVLEGHADQPRGYTVTGPPDAPVTTGTVGGPGGGLVFQLVGQGTPLIVRNIADAPELMEHVVIPGLAVRAFVKAPLNAPDGIVGTVNFMSCSPREFTAPELETIARFTDAAAVSLRYGLDERRLQARIAELEQANRARDEFLADLSHELRTPLTAITAWTELLENLYVANVPDVAEDLREGVSTILTSATALGRMIEDLVDLTRLQHRPFELELAPTEFQSPVRQAIQMVRYLAQSKGIEFVVDLGKPIPLLIDPPRLQQIVWNVLTNSIKFTPPGGRILISAREVGGGAEIEIVDTGIGIEPAFLPRVFDRFRQETHARKRSYRGLGIGLAITRALVEAHGGTITVKSSGRNQGTAVTIVLPRPLESRPPVPDAPAVGMPIVSSSGTGHEILIVEDDVEVAQIIGRMVRVLGYRPRVAYSASVALSWLETTPPALVLTDVNMPDLNGFEFLSLIRANPALADLPVVALTGFVTAADMARMEAAAFDAILAKPVRQAKLADTLAERLLAGAS